MNRLLLIMLCALLVCGSAKAKLQANYDDANDVAILTINSDAVEEIVLSVAACDNEINEKDCAEYDLQMERCLMVNIHSDCQIQFFCFDLCDSAAMSFIESNYSFEMQNEFIIKGEKLVPEKSEPNDITRQYSSAFKQVCRY